MKPTHRMKAPSSLITYVKDAARFVFARNGCHMPQVVARIGDDVELYMTAFAGDTRDEIEFQKDQWANLLHTLAAKADELAFIAECWMKEIPREADIQRIIDEGVGNQSDKREFIRIVWGSPAEEKVFMAEIYRYEGAKPILGEWQQESAPLSETGRFTNIFQKARQHERN